MTKIHTSIIFVTFCALEVFLSWKVLGKGFQEYSLFDVLRDVAVIAACAKFLLMYRCLRERFVVGLVIFRFVVGLVSGFMLNLVNGVAGLVRAGDLALWVLALLVSLSMLIQSAWNPNVGSEDGSTMTVRRRLLILSAFIVTALLLGTLLYFVPQR